MNVKGERRLSSSSLCLYFIDKDTEVIEAKMCLRLPTLFEAEVGLGWF